MNLLRRAAVWLGLAVYDPLPRMLDCGDRNAACHRCPDCDWTACEHHRHDAHDCRTRRADQIERELW